MSLHGFNPHWLGIFGTALVMIAYVPQIVHLAKMHCGDGVSLSAYALWTSASALLFVYAVFGGEPVFSTLQAYNTLACGLILLLGVRYRQSRCPLHALPPAEEPSRVD